MISNRRGGHAVCEVTREFALAGMWESRHQFHEALTELEHRTLGGLDLVIQQLDGALMSVSCQDVELARMVIADDDRINGRYREVHQSALSLLARQAPVAGDLRLVAALLHIIRCIERMGDQCVNIAKLVPLSGYEATTDADILATIERMGRLARAQVLQAKEAFATRDIDLARELVLECPRGRGHLIAWVCPTPGRVWCPCQGRVRRIPWSSVVRRSSWCVRAVRSPMSRSRLGSRIRRCVTGASRSRSIRVAVRA